MISLIIITLLVIDLTYHIDRDFNESKLAYKVINLFRKS